MPNLFDGRPLFAPPDSRPGTASLLLLVLIAPLITGCVYSTPEWSPDGQHLAFLAQIGDEHEILPPGWLLGIEDAQQQADAEVRRELWIGRIADRSFRRIDETAGWICVPAWAPDGKSLIYTRFTPSDGNSDDGQGRLELIRRYRDGRFETLRTLDGDCPLPLLEMLPYRMSAWSPDGRDVAVPWIGESSLFVWSLSKGRVEAQWPTADLPSWSPDSSWLATYDRGVKPGFHVHSATDWTGPAKVIELATAIQPARWDPSSDAIYVARPPFVLTDPTGERSDFRVAQNRQTRFTVERIALPSLDRQTAFSVARPSQKSRQFTACYFDIDWLSETAFASVLAENSSSRIDVIRLLERNNGRSWHPIETVESDSLLPVGAVRCSPGGHHVAIRFGVADWSAPIAVCGIPERTVDIWTPTLSMRTRAIWAVVQSLIRQVQSVAPGTPLPYGIGRDHSVENLYVSLAERKYSSLELFPIPSILLGRDATSSARDHRRITIDDLARIGLRLVESPPNRELSEQLRTRFLEAELFFHYCRGDYLAAIESLNALQRLIGKQPAVNLRCLLTIIRIQCFGGAGRNDAARWELSNLFRETSNRDRKETPSHSEPLDENIRARLHELHEIFHPIDGTTTLPGDPDDNIE